jgi:lysophospholipase L1-like esterase
VVANLGQYGYGPLEELAVLRRFGLPLHPRTVIWMFFEGNDLNDVLRYRKASVRGRTPQRFWSSFWERSFTINALAQIRKQYRQLSRPFGKKRSGTIGEPNAQQRTIYFVYSAPPLSSEQLDAFNQTLDTIATAHQLCANHASRLIFVFIPAKFRVFRDLCKFPEASECRKWSLNDLPDRMSKAIRAVSADIRYLDLTRDFIGSVRRGELPYYADDDHWSPEGHKVAAEAINAYLPSDSKQSPPHMIASRSELRQ